MRPASPPNRSPSSLAGFPGREALLAVVLYAFMVFHQRGLEPSVVALQFTYSRECFAAIVERWGAEAGRLPANLLIDLPFLAAYGLFGYRLATRTPLAGGLPPSLRSVFAGLLPVAAGVDALENFLEFSLAGNLASAAEGLFLAAGLVSALKWALIALFIAAAGVAFVRRR